MRSTRAGALIALAALPFCAGAYEPPVDRAGPLTVRINRPAAGAYGAGGFLDLNQPDKPFAITVQLENSGDSAVRGMLRMGVIDRWRVEPPNPVPFEVGPRGRASRQFTVSFGPGTFNAHYPVHAWAEFEHQGRKLTAHPILILTTSLPDPPRAPVPVEYAPVRVPARGSLGLWRLPVRREHAGITAEPAQSGATGREIFALSPVVRYEARGLTMTLGPRPPSRREGVDSARVEYPLALPPTKPLRLEFATSGKATFRVRVVGPSGEGATVFTRDSASASAAGAPASVDLSAFAGRSVRLQFEATGGPGEAQWLEPAVIAGEAPQAAVFPPASAGNSRVLGKAGEYEVRVWPGTRGALDAAAGFIGPARRLYFRGFRVRVAGDQLETWRSGTELLQVLDESAGERYRLRHKFRGWAGAFDLISELWVEKGALQARFQLENAPPPRPWLHVHLEEVSAGEWSDRALRVYGGPGNVIQEPSAFRLGFDGHNLATSFIGLDFANGVALLQGSDVTPDRLEVNPGERIYSLAVPHTQTLTFLPGASVWDAVKQWRGRNLWRASAGVEKLAGRFVFDLWSGRYGPSAKALERAFRYGLTDSVVVWHNWQRWGYDFRLPDLYPPNPQFGSEEEFRALVAVCRSNGVLFAPHDNYIDFYPDSDGFSYGNIAFRPNGEPYRAWFHAARDAQSYRARADRVQPLVERNLRLIKAGFAPTAYFIDVWSSIAPYDYWTEDGRFVERSVTRKAWGEAFAWIRDYLGDNAPQISEAGHDQLIGWLDGAQANQLRVDPKSNYFTWRIEAADAERIPWIDAAYHDRFVLHGAGYPDRYAGGLDAKAHGAYSDDYMATEVLTGRPAMVAAPFGRDVVRKYWLLHDAMRALALKPMADFQFVGGNLHRQRVRWEGGGEVHVNRGADEWKAGDHVLPQYGFHVRAGDVEAAVEKLGAATVEWSRSPAMLYVNGRGEPADFGGVVTRGACRLTRVGAALQVTAAPEGGAFPVRLRWNRLPWKLAEPSQAEAVGEDGAVMKTVPAGREGGEVVLNYESGVFAYRLR